MEKKGKVNTYIVKPESVQQSGNEDPIISPEDKEKQREDEIKEMKHTNRKLIVWIARAIIILGAIFLVALFFVILPISQMGDEYARIWDAIRSWSNAFLGSGRTIGVTILAIIISDVLKKLFPIAIDSIKKATEN